MVLQKGHASFRITSGSCTEDRGNRQTGDPASQVREAHKLRSLAPRFRGALCARGGLVLLRREKMVLQIGFRVQGSGFRVEKRGFVQEKVPLRVAQGT